MGAGGVPAFSADGDHESGRRRSLRRRHGVPIPAALVLFATAVGLGLLGYRRRKLGA
jgi:hypothetical protein